MRILYYDCFSGISGDMNLAAMIDLGVDRDYLINELEKLKFDSYEIKITRDNRKGIEGTKVDVILEEEHDHHHEGHAHSENNQGHTHEHEHEHNHEYINECAHQHDHKHIHDHESIEHAPQAENHVHSHHHHRNLKDIEHIINSSELNEKIKKLSMDMFLKVAVAEGKIHGKDLMEVHFHEVGAVDSIVDIVGSAICLDFLKIDKVMASTVEVGGGFVKCAHGTFPVPAPATAEILKGIPIRVGTVPFETTTPTGAAILASTVDEFTDKKEFTIEKIGYGIGHRDTEIPNVLRVYIGQADIKEAALSKEDEREEAVLLECNIDDMNPEIYDYVLEELFSKGVMDAYLTPIIMKKGRPAVKISVLCSGEMKDSVVEVLLKETTTLGVRFYKLEKIMLQRKISTVDTAYGQVKVKSSYYEGTRIKFKAEYDDCKRIAREKNLPINEVYKEVEKAMNN